MPVNLTFKTTKSTKHFSIAFFYLNNQIFFIENMSTLEDKI